MGTQPPPQKGGIAPNFWPVSCGQMAVCFRIPLGTGVGLSLGDIVLDGDPAPTPLKGHSPQFSANIPLWPNGWMVEHATWYGSGPLPGPFCVRRGPSSPRKGHSSPPLFGPCLLQKHSFIYSSLVFTDDRSCADCSRLNIASLDVVVSNQI